MIKVKFCGLRTKDDIDFVNKTKPDFAGFILSDGFKRTIDYDTAETLSKNVDSGISRVGVFVDDSIEFILNFVYNNVIDIIQLHGSEDDDFISSLRKKTDKKIIKMFKIKNADDLANAKNSSADFVLLDSGCGTGEKFDWSLISDFDRDFFLAGGLNTKNIHEAVTNLSPYAVDISSGVETDGKKDLEKMKYIIETVKGCGNFE